MKLLVDFHHADLFESHQLVFGDRFGWDVFAPWGREWFDEWYWSFERSYHGDAVALQYLVGIFSGGIEKDGIISVPDRRHPGRVIRGVSLERARSEGWDWVMSSVPDNAAGFRKFARETGARWAIHVGNQWGDEAWASSPDAAILTTTSVIPAGIPHVVVHQEFSLDDFRPEPPIGFGPIRSFVNCFPENIQPCAHGSVSNPDGEYGYFRRTASGFPEFTWEVCGAYGTAPADEFVGGNLESTPALGDKMRGAGVIWHAKHWSDGFGHVIHNAFSVGRPVIGYEDYYRDKLAGPLWIDGVTSFDLQRRSPDEIAAIIRSLRDDQDRYLTMCEAAAARFTEIVSFDEDAAQIAGLFGATVREPVPA